MKSPVKKRLVIGWKVASLSENLASVRYRAMLPLLALEEECGVQCCIFSDPYFINFDKLDVLIIVKSFTAEDLFLVQQAVREDIPVILDLCDNIFISSYGTNFNKTNVSEQIFLSMAKLSQVVVVTTDPLAKVAKCKLGDSIPIYVIPDGIESLPLVDKIRMRLSRTLNHEKKGFTRKIQRGTSRVKRAIQDARQLGWLIKGKQIIKKLLKESFALGVWHINLAGLTNSQVRKVNVNHDGAAMHDSSMPPAHAKRILWFGNHGAPYARFGMLDLLEIREALEKIADEFEVELVVVSNHTGKFKEYIQPLGIRTRYVEWSHAALHVELRRASVVVVPNSLDHFSICKSANRSILALSAGVPVVATCTPALLPLEDCIIFDKFLEGLRIYLGDKSRAEADVNRGRHIIQEKFSQKAIANEWSHVLSIARNKENKIVESDVCDLIVVLHLIQDLDLAAPILEAARRKGVRTVVYCSVSLLNKSPRVMNVLAKIGLPVLVLPDDEERGKAFPPFPQKVRALLTMAESNLGPHRFSRWWTEQAQKHGIITGTLQHGFENVGLTYDDEIHPINGVDIASDKIYLWGPLNTLHPKVSGDRKRKCIPVGCPKVKRQTPVDLSEFVTSNQLVIGVFENLHWHRYTEAYREFFLNGVLNIANQFSSILFLVKTHHAGMWLSKKKKEWILPPAENLIVIDPVSPQWEPYTATAFFENMNAVISSPSTVALDAARASLPVAVVAFNLLLDNYSPLTKIQRHSDWIKFVDLIVNDGGSSSLIELSRHFVERVVLSDDGAERIIENLCTHHRRE